jgi:peptide/nickel transport system substrate-binding protein
MAVMDYIRCNMFYDGLVSLDEHQRPQMALAETLDSPDGRVWTARLRKGVRFHDGKLLTPTDVVYSLRRHMDPAVGSTARTFMAQFEAIEALGEDGLRITLTGPNADLPVILGMQQFKIIRNQTRDFRTANGTGPFRCTEFTPGCARSRRGSRITGAAPSALARSSFSPFPTRARGSTR